MSDMESFFPIELILARIQEIEEEEEVKCCGTCGNNILVMAEMGLCKLKETCFCQGNTSGVTDFWDCPCDNYLDKNKPL